ncbi:PH domain leucine-rich repeat-containing protein phosphatase 2 [Eucyclogobius newberryi]|uniref:PH domain leucine-rich repeat-containing protein phosphatase 2 n=1 Tax=Eucyclogobius newberryi TaxID=166745 RepID=UPI003B5928BE
MAMKDKHNSAVAVASTEQVGTKSGGDVGDSGARSGRQPPEEVVKQTGLGHTAGRGGRSGLGARNANGIRVLKRNMNRNGSRSCVTRKSRFGSRERDWLKGDTQRGCVCLYGGTVDIQPSASGAQSSSTPQNDLQLVLCTTSTTVQELCAQRQGKALYVQLHGDSVRRLDLSERPLQMVYEYLTAMGHTDPVRIQQEAANSDLSCLIRFYSERPANADQQERTLLKGVFSVRKGKTQLHKWAERQVILCGTCLIVASVKDSLMGKMHIMPLVGGKVEEVKRRQHCLMFSSAGSQAQTYFVIFDTLADYQRWYRQASKIVSQTVSLVDLSCYSLETVPEYLFYSQDITHLNLRHNFMTLEGAGSLINLPRFSQLKTLNLSHNRLGVFPECVCDVLTLNELNLSCNNLHSIPSQIGNLLSLQTLFLDGNLLNFLPEELGGLSQLNSLGLSFNNFSQIPAVMERLSGVDKLAMAGNRVESLELCTLIKINHLKNIDLRLNGLRCVKSDSLKALSQVTQLDLRDNRLASLDLSSVSNLEILHCQRNQLGMLTLSGFTLRMLNASSNRLTTVNIYPVPNLLTHLELSQNLLEHLPDWVCDCRKIEMVDVAHNILSELPSRLLSSLSLRKLLVGNNHLERVPDFLDHIPLESLDLQHNKLSSLPESLFYKALNLKYLNLSANALENIPSCSQSEESLSTLQELYLTRNNLNENCGSVLVGHQNLRVLHIAYNHLLSFPPSKLSKLELLEELNLSGNKLKTIPSTVSSCKKLHTLLAHSNNINVFPEILSLPEIKFVDLSCNELTEIQLPESLPPSLQELDLTGNNSLTLEHKALNLFSHITTLKIDLKSTTTGESQSTCTPWNHGFSETRGQRNKLCVSVLAVDQLGDSAEACYGVFDGDRNEEVPRLLQCTMGDVLCEEIQHSGIDYVYMSNTFLTSHRKLGMTGQKLGASALLCYIHHEPSDLGGYSLTVANVGTCQAVLCRNGQPVALSKVFSLENSTDEMERIKLCKAIITEDNKVSGVTCCSRLLGCSYLSPWVLPKPYVHTVPLCSQDEFLILGNRALFERVSYQEAVCTVQAARDPHAAAKKLCSLAQSFGCKDNIGALVVSLHISEDSCTCEAPVTDPYRGLNTNPPPLTVPPGPSEPATLSSSSGGVSELNSEMSTSEVGSEAGSTASDEHTSITVPRSERRCSIHPATVLCGIMVPGSINQHPGVFQRQPSCATFSSNQSDNNLDSDDEAQVQGVMSNGSKLEVEVDIHCCAFQLRSVTPDSIKIPNFEKESVKLCNQNSDVASATNGCLLAICGRDIVELKKSASNSCLFGKKLSNGSVVAPEDSHNIIEVALEAPKKKSGYFTAPAQQDPEDQLIVPPSLEQEVREQLRGQAPVVQCISTASITSALNNSVWHQPHASVFASPLVSTPGLSPMIQREVYDTAL